MKDQARQSVRWYADPAGINYRQQRTLLRQRILKKIERIHDLEEQLHA